MNLEIDLRLNMENVMLLQSVDNIKINIPLVGTIIITPSLASLI